MLKQGHHRVGVEEMELARLRLGILCISPFGRNAGGGGGEAHRFCLGENCAERGKTTDTL